MFPHLLWAFPVLVLTGYAVVRTTDGIYVKYHVRPTRWRTHRLARILRYGVWAILLALLVRGRL